MDSGTRMRAFAANQIESILVEHGSSDITPQQFKVTADEWTFSTKLEVGMETLKFSMQGNQFPIISNSCATVTGHKLQGCTVDKILINDFNCQKNWPCVALSRVKTMDGLHLRQKLSLDLLEKCEMSPDMLKMLEHFGKMLSLKISRRKRMSE